MVSNGGWGDALTPSRGFQHLANLPLRSLTHSDLDLYAFKAITSWGTQQDFKHFLPRLLELALDDLLAFSLPEVLLGKLQLAGWHEWPTLERQAVKAVLLALWRGELNRPGNFPDEDRIATLLAGLAAAGESLTPYLHVWQTEKGELPTLHLARLVSFHADSIMTSGVVYLWDEPDRASQEVVSWIRSDAVLRILESHEAIVERVFPLVLSQLEGVRAL